MRMPRPWRGSNDGEFKCPVRFVVDNLLGASDLPNIAAGLDWRRLCSEIFCMSLRPS